MAKNPDWFETGYSESANETISRKSLNFVNSREGSSEAPKDDLRPLRKAAAKKLWEPQEFYLSAPLIDGKVKPGARPTTVKMGIFVDDSRGVLRRHNAFIPNPAFKNGGSWGGITCAGKAGPLKFYEYLKDYKGPDKDETPGLFPSCCGEHFLAKTRDSGRLRPGIADGYVVRTIIDPAHVDGKGVVFPYVPKLVLAKGIPRDKLDELSAAHRDADMEGRGIEGALVEFKRFAGEKTNALGDEIRFKRYGDVLAIVPQMTYHGQPLAQLMVDCWNDAELKEALGEIFEIPEERPETGYWVPVFNYASVLAPWSQERLNSVFPLNKSLFVADQPARSYSVKVAPANIPGFGGEDEAETGTEVDDDIPF